MSIHERLDEFARSKYGDERGYKAKLSKELEISSSQVSQYLSGARIPGSKIQKRLRNIGCDIEWLISGERNNQQVVVESKEDLELKALKQYYRNSNRDELLERIASGDDVYTAQQELIDSLNRALKIFVMSNKRLEKENRELRKYFERIEKEKSSNNNDSE